MALEIVLLRVLSILLLVLVVWLWRNKSRVESQEFKPDLIAKIQIYHQGIDIFAKLDISGNGTMTLKLNNILGMLTLEIDGITIVIGNNLKMSYGGYSDVRLAVEPMIIAPRTYEIQKSNENYNTWNLYQKNRKNNLVVIEFNSRLIPDRETLN